jgi:hypothetical protein
MACAAACGGQAFTLAPGDASVVSVVSDGHPESATGEGGAEDGQAGDDASDASIGEGSVDGGATDTGTDAGSSMDAIALPDAFEEPPPHCESTDFECIPSIPAGWEGPFEVYRGPTPAPSCSPNFFPSYQGSQGIDAGAASCTCSCGAATGVQCSPVTASFYVSSAGVGTCLSAAHCTSVVLPTGQCMGGINAPAQCSSLLGTTDMTVTGSQPDGGSCAPTPTTTLPPVTWSTTTRACISTIALAQVDCPAGSLCAPKPALPFPDSTLCIAQSGDVLCPAGSYATRSVSYGAASDGRRCTGCNCGPVTGSSCSGYVDVSSANSSPCSSGSNRYIFPQSCAAVQQPGDFRATVNVQPGSCAATVPTPAGTAAAAAPTTFCCE